MYVLHYKKLAGFIFKGYGKTLRSFRSELFETGIKKRGNI